jgi:hypothetical protein
MNEEVRNGIVHKFVLQRDGEPINIQVTVDMRDILLLFTRLALRNKSKRTKFANGCIELKIIEPKK